MSWSRSIIMRHFYPRPPRGGRLELALLLIDGGLFLSTPSARRATQCLIDGELEIFISIHALREEGDQSCTLNLPCHENFYPRPPRGGRPEWYKSKGGKEAISIHALREEGDCTSSVGRQPRGDFYPRPPRGGRPSLAHLLIKPVRFLSTPSARRATQHLPFTPVRQTISIHALREEGDSGECNSGASSRISIHALREEGDLSIFASKLMICIFLSTPSARRATAKTETKALFSNKLYNILHEFRRALIYNWSKNYPNRAK